MIDVKKPLFKLGRVVATPGCLEAFEETKQSGWEFLTRHARGDWGNVDEHDRQANEDALQDGSRIFSVYHLNDETKIYVITEADRSSTCCLLPKEY